MRAKKRGNMRTCAIELMSIWGLDGYQVHVYPEFLGSPEIFDHMLSLHRNLVELGGPLVPLPPRGADIDLPH